MSSTPTIETGLLKQVDGSAVWKQDITKVICSVSGPMEAKVRDEQPTTATIELVVRPIVGLSSTRETVLEDRIYSVLSSVILRHLHPRTLIQTVVQVLESGEDTTTNNALEMAAGINATVTAMIDAGIPMQGVAIAVVVAIDDNDELVFNPNGEQLKQSKSNHVVAYEIKGGKADRLLLCESQGKFTQKQLIECIDKSAEPCEHTYKELRAAMGDKIKKDFVWK